MTSSKKTLPTVSWPQSLVLVALIAGAVVSAILAPEDIRIALGVLITAVAGLLQVRK